eukprot:3391369-Prorocentrum_lima.AAC.1
MLACVFRYGRAVGEISRAFLHVPDDEEIYGKPPEEWTQREAEKARSKGQQWRPQVRRLTR